VGVVYARAMDERRYEVTPWFGPNKPGEPFVVLATGRMAANMKGNIQCPEAEWVDSVPLDTEVTDLPR
jgi:hypothetical protein